MAGLSNPFPGLLTAVGDWYDRNNIGTKLVGGGVRGAASRGLLGMVGAEDETPVQRNVRENVERGAAPALGAGKAVFLGAKAAKAGLNFDPRFDPRIKERDRLQGLLTTVETRPMQAAPSVSLADFEGRPFITSMSDRTAAGGLLTEVNGTQLNRPVNLRGGQDYMFDNPGQVWASAPTPVAQIMRQAQELKAATGQDPLFLPWRMAPSGGDFAHMTGETMINYADAAMGKRNKAAMDKAIKQFIPEWGGVSSDKAVDQFRAAPDSVRKAIKNMLDVEFRDRGGLSIGEARLSVADKKQLTGSDGQIMNIGQIMADAPVLEKSGHPSYPRGVPGMGVGRADVGHNIFELLPQVVAERGIHDPRKPRATDLRALQMKPYAGILDDQLLKSLGY